MGTAVTNSADEDKALELKRLEQMCLPPWHTYRSTTLALRPERPEYSTLRGKPVPPDPVWEGVIRKLHAGLLGDRPEKSSISELHHGLCNGNKDDVHGFGLLLAAVAGILYAAEKFQLEVPPPLFDDTVPLFDDTGPSFMHTPPLFKNKSRTDVIQWWVADKLKKKIIPEDTTTLLCDMGRATDCVLEHMLLEDYTRVKDQGGESTTDPPKNTYIHTRLNQHRLLKLNPKWQNFWKPVWEFSSILVIFSCLCITTRPTRTLFRYFAFFLKIFKGPLDPADFGIMMMYYATRTSQYPQNTGEFGSLNYSGVLNDMIDNIPTRGPKQLLRKLSVDVNEIIPVIIQSPQVRRELVGIAQEIALQHGLVIHAPFNCSRHMPEFEALYEYGMPVTRQRRTWLGRMGRSKAPERDTRPARWKRLRDRRPWLNPMPF